MVRLVAMLEDASLVEVYVADDGQEAHRLAKEGVRIAHMLAMGGEADADATLEALLGPDRPP